MLATQTSNKQRSLLSVQESSPSSDGVGKWAHGTRGGPNKRQPEESTAISFGAWLDVQTHSRSDEGLRQGFRHAYARCVFNNVYSTATADHAHKFRIIERVALNMEPILSHPITSHSVPWHTPCMPAAPVAVFWICPCGHIKGFFLERSLPATAVSARKLARKLALTFLSVAF